METLIKKIDSENMSSEDFVEAVDFLRKGKLVAFPTETVYGLGGNAFDPTASARIYAAKGRPSDNPLIVHIAKMSELGPLCREIPEAAYKLADKFWPGPLTMIMKKTDSVPKETTGGLDTVAIRMPSHPIARKLIEESQIPIAAPSANASGRPSTTKAEHVIEDLDGKIDMIIDGGSSDIGLESTIVDLTCEPIQILRPGFITIEMIQSVIPDVIYDRAVLKRDKNENIVARAPGMKYRHYAPKGELTIYEGEPEAVTAAVIRAAKERLAEGFSVGILASNEYEDVYREAFEGAIRAGADAQAQAEHAQVLPQGASENSAVQNFAVKNMEILADSVHGTSAAECAANSYAASGIVIEVVGSREDEASIAANLFDKLRDFDAKGTQYIFGECFTSSNLGAAIMNRLVKAAGYHIENV